MRKKCAFATKTKLHMQLMTFCLYLGPTTKNYLGVIPRPEHSSQTFGIFYANATLLFVQLPIELGTSYRPRSIYC